MQIIHIRRRARWPGAAGWRWCVMFCLHINMYCMSISDDVSAPRWGFFFLRLNLTMCYLYLKIT